MPLIRAHTQFQHKRMKKENIFLYNNRNLGLKRTFRRWSNMFISQVRKLRHKGFNIVSPNHTALYQGLEYIPLECPSSTPLKLHLLSLSNIFLKRKKAYRSVPLKKPQKTQNLRKCLSDNQVLEKQKQAFNTRSNNHLLSIHTQYFKLIIFCI